MHFTVNCAWFAVGILLFVFQSLGVRFIGTEHHDCAYHRHALFIGGAAFATVWAMWNFDFRMLCVYEGLIFWGTSPLYTQKIISDRISGIEASEAFVFSVLSYGIPFFITGALVRTGIEKSAAGILLTVSLIVSSILPIAGWGCLLCRRRTLDSDTVIALFQTHLAELAAFVRMQRKRDLTLLAVVTVCVGILFRGIAFSVMSLSVVESIQGNSCYLWMSLGFLFFVYACVRLFLENRQYFLVSALQGVFVLMGAYKEYSRGVEKRCRKLAERTGSLSADDGLYVLVIGESETRDHVSAFGYERPTAPWLEKMVEEEKALLFKNAYSCHTLTVKVLAKVLTLSNQYNGMELKDADSIVDVANLAGFETYWLSNQRRFGTLKSLDSPVSVIGGCCTVQHWINGKVGEGTSGTFYDEELLKFLPVEKNGTPRLVIVHLLGSHFRYSDRYPGTRKYFEGGVERVDSYDDSVRYTHDVLRRIYGKVKGLSDFRAMVYLPDHGEDCETGMGHDPSSFLWQMARIPLVVFPSDKFKTERAGTWNALRFNADRVWTNDLTFELMAGLMDIRGFDGIDPRFCLTSEEYSLTEEKALTLYGEKYVSDDIIKKE